MKNVGACKLAVIVIAMAVFLPGASAEEKILEGFVIGRVYEIDKERYREYIEEKRAQDLDFDETLAELDAMDFVDEREEVMVSGRQLATNATFVSELSDETGEYAIRETPVGTYEFTLRHEGFDYPVKQRLDLNVQLDYVAELCFVIDREEQVAWRAVDDVRRTSDVPPVGPENLRLSFVRLSCPHHRHRRNPSRWSASFTCRSWRHGYRDWNHLLRSGRGQLTRTAKQPTLTADWQLTAGN